MSRRRSPHPRRPASPDPLTRRHPLGAAALCAGLLAGLTGCPATELLECYPGDECAGGQTCVAGKCVTGGADARPPADARAPDLGPTDGGRPDGGPDARPIDAADLDARPGDVTVSDAAPPDVTVADRGPDAAPLDPLHCRVIEGDVNPAFPLAPDPYGYAVVSTRPDRVVRITARSPTFPEATPQPGDGKVIAHCSPPHRVDVEGSNTALELGQNVGIDGGRPAVKALVAGGRLHVGWWVYGPREQDPRPRSLRGASYALDADGCPDGATRQGWEQPAHPYAADFDLVWLSDRLFVGLGRPTTGDFYRLNLLPAIDEPTTPALGALQYNANFVSLVATPDGRSADVFGSVVPTQDNLLVHARVALEGTDLVRRDSGETDDGRFTLDVARLMAAVNGPGSQVGLLAQELPGREDPQPDCVIPPPPDAGTVPETNGAPQQLVFYVFEHGADPEIRHQVYGTPIGATGDPLYAGLAWHPELARYAVAFSAQHGTANPPDDNGVRLALLRDDGEPLAHLSLARYDATCQTVTHRPVITATGEGFFITWLHRYEHLRHARLVCTPP